MAEVFLTLMKNINPHIQKLNDFQVEKHKEIHNQIHHSKNVNVQQRNRFENIKIDIKGNKTKTNS